MFRAYWDEGKQEQRIQLYHGYVHSWLRKQHLAESYGLSNSPYKCVNTSDN